MAEREAARRSYRDAGGLRSQLTAWIAERVSEAGAKGALFGVSGGIDSAVVCGLAAEALGPERCLALILPIESLQNDQRLAEQVADHFRVRHIRVDLEPPFLALVGAVSQLKERAERESRALNAGAEPENGDTESRAALARANIKPRLRMTALYYFANLLDYLVIGTGNRDERVVGYFTKWGDGAADIAPLGDLLKEEVRALGRELGVPAEVIERAPSAGLWPDQTDEDELGIRYAELDRFLLRGTSGDPAVDERIRACEVGSRHKRNPVPIARPEG